MLVLVATRSWNKVQTDKIKVFNYTRILLGDNLPGKDELYNGVKDILKVDSLNLREEWNESYSKLMAIQEDCLLHDDYERLSGYLPVYKLFSEGGNNLKPLLDDDYYEIIESNEDVKTKLTAHSVYDYYKEKIMVNFQMRLYLKYIMMQEYIIYQLVIKLVMREEMKEKISVFQQQLQIRR